MIEYKPMGPPKLSELDVLTSPGDVIYVAYGTDPRPAADPRAHGIFLCRGARPPRVGDLPTIDARGWAPLGRDVNYSGLDARWLPTLEAGAVYYRTTKYMSPRG